MTTTTNPNLGPNAVPNREFGPNGELSAWIARQFPEGFQGYAVDVGASDGISISTTYVLEQNRWTVLCIEPNPIFWPKLKARRAFVQTCACDREPREKALFYALDQNPEAYSALRPTFPPDFPVTVGWSKFEVPVKTLEQCLYEAQFPRLDALCIDVEGNDLDVLKGIDLNKWAPRVIVIEAWTQGVHDEHLKLFGYERVSRSVDNDLYRRGVDGDTAASPTSA